jgi:hypothetical protein
VHLRLFPSGDSRITAISGVLFEIVLRSFFHTSNEMNNLNLNIESLESLEAPVTDWWDVAIGAAAGLGVGTVIGILIVT